MIKWNNGKWREDMAIDFWKEEEKKSQLKLFNLHW